MNDTTAEKNWAHISPYMGNAVKYNDYDSYVVDSLRAADMRVAEGNMKYYTADEIRSGLEALLSEKI